MSRKSASLSLICFFTVLGLLVSGSMVLAQPAAEEWIIDNGLKLHLAYVHNERLNLPKETPMTNTSWLGLTPESVEAAPDITNINLAGILGLGFPLATRDNPGSFTFYLKFFEYPAFLSAPTSFGKIFDRFRLHHLPGFAQLQEYVKVSGNVLVKLGHIAPTGTEFSSKAPYPALSLPSAAIKMPTGEVSPQDYFDSEIPFSSIYVTPASPEPLDATPENKAKWSAEGVIAFHKALIVAFEKNLKELKGAEPEKFRYFSAPSTEKTSALSVLKIPLQPMLFGNFRDLPMPQDPKKVFLSGLLLVYSTDYRLADGKNPAEQIIDSPEFLRDFPKESPSVLEVGSVVRF